MGYFDEQVMLLDDKIGGTYALTVDPISVGGSASVSGAFEGPLIGKCRA